MLCSMMTAGFRGKNPVKDWSQLSMKRVAKDVSALTSVRSHYQLQHIVNLCLYMLETLPALWNILQLHQGLLKWGQHVGNKVVLLVLLRLALIPRHMQTWRVPVLTADFRQCACPSVSIRHRVYFFPPASKPDVTVLHLHYIF